MTPLGLNDLNSFGPQANDFVCTCPIEQTEGTDRIKVNNIEEVLYKVVRSTDEGFRTPEINTVWTTDSDGWATEVKLRPCSWVGHNGPPGHDYTPSGYCCVTGSSLDVALQYVKPPNVRFISSSRYELWRVQIRGSYCQIYFSNGRPHMVVASSMKLLMPVVDLYYHQEPDSSY